MKKKVLIAVFAVAMAIGSFSLVHADIFGASFGLIGGGSDAITVGGGGALSPISKPGLVECPDSRLPESQISYSECNEQGHAPCSTLDDCENPAY